jgi:hypothetical protein
VSGSPSLPRSGLAELPSRTVSFLAETDDGEVLPNVAVSLGGEAARQSQCVTDASGRCTITIRNSGLTIAMPFRLEASGYEPGTGSFHKADVATGALLVVVHLRRLSTRNPREAEAAGQQAAKSSTGQPSSQQALPPGGQSNWLELYAAIGMTAILIMAIGWAAWWTRSPLLSGMSDLGTRVETVVNGVSRQMLDNQLLSLVKEVRDEQKAFSGNFEVAVQTVKRASEPRADDAPPRTQAEAVTPIMSGVRSVDEAVTSGSPSNDSEAQNVYRALLNDRRLLSGVLHVIREVSSSQLDMLQQTSVYMQEVSRSQGSFVLFKDRDGKRGWVFPNPELLFRKEVFGPVFPNLDRVTFESAKQSIGPVSVTAAGDKRWKVVKR